MKNDASVVIIGGGVTGCSIAYHLAKEGVEDVVVLEKGNVASGATRHAAGLVTVYNTSLDILQLRMYSVQMFNEFYSEVGDECGWNPTGSLRLAASDDQYMFLRQGISKARGLGLDIEILGERETHELWPEMSMDGVQGSIYLPQDGWLDPLKTTRFLADRARALGATILTDTLVTDIELGRRNEVLAVLTEGGRIECEAVINAAGMWSPRIAEMVGLFMPIVPVQHQHVLTVPMEDHIFPRDKPVLRDPHNLIYIREHQGGVLIGGFELNPKSWNERGVPWSHGDQQLAGDWALIDPVLKGAFARVPVLKKAELRDLVNHPDGMTPNMYACVGPSPEVPGFWGASGLSFNGFGMAGGLGREVARWFIEGQTRVDLTAFDIRRFGEHYKNTDYVSARAREIYKYYYYPKFPLDQFEWGRPYRKSPLHDRLDRLGAVFGEKNAIERANYFVPGRAGRMEGPDQRKNFGWQRPDYWSELRAEHEAIRERVGILDMSSFGKIEVKGPGALALLQRVAANNVDRPVDSLIYTQFLNERGGIESDLTIARLDVDHFRLVTGTSSPTIDKGWLRYHKPDGAQVEIVEVTEEFGCISLWGPLSRQVLAGVSTSDFSNEAFPYISSRAIEIDGIEARANRVSFAGELGWEIYPRAEEAGQVWDRLMIAGEAHGIRPCGYRAIDSLRLEKGFLIWGTDITPNDNPFEAGLGFAVCLDQGDFVGRDALLEYRRSTEPKLRMVTIVTEPDAAILYGGEAIQHGGAVVGRLRSAGHGFTVEKNIGFGYLPEALSVPGTAVELDSFDTRIPAVVTERCLYDPRGERVRL